MLHSCHISSKSWVQLRKPVLCLEPLCCKWIDGWMNGRKHEHFPVGSAAEFSLPWFQHFQNPWGWARANILWDPPEIPEKTGSSSHIPEPPSLLLAAPRIRGCTLSFLSVSGDAEEEEGVGPSTKVWSPKSPNSALVLKICNGLKSCPPKIYSSPSTTLVPVHVTSFGNSVFAYVIS